jgi:hypothetical protein
MHRAILHATPIGFDISSHDRTQDWLHSLLLLRIFFTEFIFIQLVFFLAGVPQMIHAHPHPF